MNTIILTSSNYIVHNHLTLTNARSCTWDIIIHVLNIFLMEKKLECVSEGKDLGVIVSDDLKWEQQCSQTVAKANKVLGLIKRNFIDRSKEAIIPLFKSLVRPHLEYCCQIWNPHYIKDIKLVEGVQRRATKIVWGMENLDYEERLNRLGLMRLDRSRVRSDLLETFKIINEYYDLTVDTFFNLMMLEEENIAKIYSREEADWI